MSTETPPIVTELAEILKLAETAFADRSIDASEYALIRAERLLVPGAQCAGPRCWRLTYKLARMIPDGPDAEIGKGGEVFIEVDGPARSAKVVGYGE